ncbi:MAG: hypothetical protein GTN89_02630 [Acidobacteria bacterium]|nr:hypothetical protein [Acidobacteriota bacterium]NIM62310.1 hypothetical protein [Acidobacteriota bacterium]NIO58251.1 hypothetical protein [Acidobacteriota bacterium]NIQ29280.1 hypothetical protein [Acidobacteriota bacterium]NIQ83879.1 hypothetical protein [Acidobacteriota bacterium]
MSFEQMLRKTAELPVPAALDHRVRTALRTMPFAARRFALPGMALGLAVAATLAMTVSMALSLAAAGAAETGVWIAMLVVVVYLGLSSVVALPLLLRLKLARAVREAAA